ncbi:LysE family translocator [Denitrobaculum tricleocarpae]|uniref:LysE family translocator n=1 Tax=Denitrobaculum tricleocarpae TaxID=2591009 RepID=A0A545SST8_9PROT|nr:LysE family translocator [Denitrobaculum tricleocarpae]TQV68034.1 LysE family translocator [Denitrobaculum tricleocarpae]
MLDLQTLVLFSTASLALCATPGPDMILVAARSAAQGRTAGLVTHFGVAAGSAFHAIIMALGLSQLFLAVPYAYDLVRYLGAAYLLYLAWQAFTATNSFSVKSPGGKQMSLLVIFKQGLISNILNPKVALFYLALFPQFLDPANGSVAVQIIVLAIILQVVGLGVHGVVIWLAGSMSLLLSNGRVFARWSRYFLGAVFGGLAARLIFDGQR